MDQRIFKISLAQRGFSQIALANRVGVHPSTLSRYVRGWQTVPDNMRDRLSKALGVSVARLFPKMGEETEAPKRLAEVANHD